MADSKLISLDAFRNKKEQEDQAKTEYATFVWLRCPTCKTLEYTEIVAPNGRTHKCGSIVQEVEVEVDLRAELTITNYNLAKIEALIKQNSKSRLVRLVSKSFDKALEALRQSEEIYIAKILNVTGTKILPYEGEIEELGEKLPIREKNHLGLYISEFKYQPEKRFPDIKKK